LIAVGVERQIIGLGRWDKNGRRSKSLKTIGHLHAETPSNNYVCAAIFNLIIMSQQIEIIRKPRLSILSQIESLSLDELNTIPHGFNNNILWNLGHMVAAQSGIWYKRAGLPLPIDETFFETFKPGTKPERVYTAADLNQIKALLMSTLDTIQADLQTNMFNNYTPWTTRYGAGINSIADAVAFLPFHEGLHIGAIIALRKLVG
jgi:hypothetical protein